MNTMAKFIVTALLSMFSLLSVRAQDVTIKGHVSAADDGGPLAGAALIAVGGGYSITDNDGDVGDRAEHHDSQGFHYHHAFLPFHHGNRSVLLS